MGFSSLTNQYDLDGKVRMRFLKIRDHVEQTPSVQQLLNMGYKVRMSTPMTTSGGQWWVTVYYGKQAWSDNSYTHKIPSTITSEIGAG